MFLSVIYPLRKGKNRNCPPPLINNPYIYLSIYLSIGSIKYSFNKKKIYTRIKKGSSLFTISLHKLIKTWAILYILDSDLVWGI